MGLSIGKTAYLGIVIMALLFFSGCSGLDVSQVSNEDIQRISENVIVCEEPYMRFGSGCCLDQNNNKICDNDETGNQKTSNDVVLEENTNQTINNKVNDNEIKIELNNQDFTYMCYNGEEVSDINKCPDISDTLKENKVEFELKSISQPNYQAGAGVQNLEYVLKLNGEEIDILNYCYKVGGNGCEMVGLMEKGKDRGVVDLINEKLASKNIMTYLCNYQDNDEGKNRNFKNDCIQTCENKEYKLVIKSKGGKDPVLMSNYVNFKFSSQYHCPVKEEPIVINGEGQLKIKEIYVEDVSDSLINYQKDKFTIIANINGNLDLELSDLLVDLITKSNNQRLKYNKGDDFETPLLYKVSYLHKGNNYKEGYVSTGDDIMITFIFGAIGDIGGNEHLTFRLLSEKSVDSINVITPATMSDKIIYLYPVKDDESTGTLI